MRTITLREYQPRRENLTRGEVEQLLAIREIVSLTPLSGNGGCTNSAPGARWGP